MGEEPLSLCTPLVQPEEWAGRTGKGETGIRGAGALSGALGHFQILLLRTLVSGLQALSASPTSSQVAKAGITKVQEGYPALVLGPLGFKSYPHNPAGHLGHMRGNLKCGWGLPLSQAK